MTTVPSSTASTTTTTGSSSSAAKLAENFDQFLTLLTTQLKNQDPLSPMDSAQFTQQLVQFAGVEQQINANKNLETLISLQKSSQVMGALDLMGKKVEASSDKVPLMNKQATFAYELPKNAAQAAYAITDSSGRTVFSGTADATAGRHEYTWDGKTKQGVQLPDGAYTISVAAIDAAGNPIDTTTSVIGTVTGVETGDTGAIMQLGSVKLPIDKLTAVING